MPTILVVEDNPDLRSLFRIALEGAGYKVLLAAHGKEALDVLKSQKAHLILLDLMMPVMNGWEFLESRKTDPSLSKIPVIICSASKQSSYDSLTYLTKPVELPQLFEIIKANVAH